MTRRAWARGVPLLMGMLAISGCGKRAADDAPAARDSSRAHTPTPNGAAAKPPGAGSTAATIDVDAFPVTDAMLRDNHGEMRSGELVSADKAWLASDTLGQTLVVDIYTDLFTPAMYAFFTAHPPAALISEMELNVEGGDIATDARKVRGLPGLLKRASTIPAATFRTRKGLALGDARSDAIARYGRPDSVSTSNGVERLSWDFPGDAVSNPEEAIGKRLARDSFGYHVVIFVEREKIIGMILRNDIP